MSLTIWWLRRDLRLHDNQALQAALAAGEKLLPLFIVDPFFQKAANTAQSTARQNFLWQNLQALANRLKEKGSHLIIRYGEPVSVLEALLNETGATKIFAEADFSPYARRRDDAVAANLPLELVGQTSIHHPESVLKADGDAYVVFTPYSKVWRQRPLPTAADLLPEPDTIPTPAAIASEPLPECTPVAADAWFPPGEAEARRRLHAFAASQTAPIAAYEKERNILGEPGTSRLSPYLRFGLISPRAAAVAALQAANHAPKQSQARQSAQTWLTELIWREFYISILYHYPHVARGNFRSKYDAIAWGNDATEFAAWKNGRTGFPIVDAAMRQLRQTGWMHNRARMIVASFLVKDLLIDWRWGEKWFMQQLIDGDLAANNGGWQWAAGTGTDAAPYFRIFNPTTQSKKFDPDGQYIRRWVQELANIPAKYIHEPHKMPRPEQKQAGCIIGQDYPQPIVDHKSARQRTLAAYKQATGTT